MLTWAHTEPSFEHIAHILFSRLQLDPFPSQIDAYMANFLVIFNYTSMLNIYVHIKKFMFQGYADIL